MITPGSALWRRVWLLKFGASAAAVAPRQSWRRMFMLERRVTNSLPLSFVNFSVRRSFVMKRVMEAVTVHPLQTDPHVASERDKYLSMPLADKRSLYKCGQKFIPIEDVDDWPTYAAAKNITGAGEAATFWLAVTSSCINFIMRHFAATWGVASCDFVDA
ncbi:unnamed protein product [Ixodes pacificus]